MNKLNVEGFPSIYYLKNEGSSKNIYEFKNKRTLENLQKFLEFN